MIRVRLQQSPLQATTCLWVSFSPKKHELLPSFSWKYEVSCWQRNSDARRGSDIHKDFVITLLSPGFSYLIQEYEEEAKT